ncbi:hypothetical protein CHLRE_12g526339v5 [Chlamydomonas reinhardtii]|uniref:Uncharacterized protein n=1 Tax=Chlamydomonas reinhardtii TaxID=3055 RepID=A0A2K3D4F9_CHLRE|nr:uncharacterized protein CHLRE_12g526201v5 [Chlamydomonas reinhardtii]XP_042918587.1 uncharacterized protein CHLRE_12g526339v5 [Chlamydomonas reinhardtii]PNW75422.1 hypothetical protein CHLRE_12g526201v5 [Chlamydomonas reinhardtii]PNW75436.1 hypothetical protein CHLRE_12g526339v5 [Chlamydomonas reinhardtii]
MNALEIVVRPAVDSVEAALDRIKMNMNLKFADWGLPCPITGQPGAVAHAAAAAAGGQHAASGSL